MYTTLSVKSETAKKLRILKIERGARNMDELIRELLQEVGL
jgi:hypothetical protein